ncbi:hypothetical protein D9757_008073 [Collybiopsis confluens]|uniref:Uncharacterized protein n=1 Tax=Collybiopsis confluens TaxID=2823264 RepID=A0A8H5H710_9AGAR|nr:hypothetical protein D9757_008073 [Collybiopsis confluens]
MSKHHPDLIMCRRQPGIVEMKLSDVYVKNVTENVQCAILTSAQKLWYASATSVISVLMVVDALSAAHPEFLMPTIVPSVRDLRKTEMGVQKL